MAETTDGKKTAIAYYLNYKEIQGWGETLDGHLTENDIAVDAAIDNLTDYEPGDVLDVILNHIDPETGRPYTGPGYEEHEFRIRRMLD